jgi:type I restriction enzyme S subunit
MGPATMPLSDICELVTIPVDPRSHPEAIYLGLEHLASGRFVRIGAGSAAEVQSSKYAFRAGDVLYGKLRPYLDKAVLTDGEGVCTTELLVLRPKEGVDPHFLVGVVHSPSFIEHAVAGTTGVQHPRTSWAHIKTFELPDFEETEQRKIGSLLLKVHDAIAANETAIGAGTGLKRAAMRMLFTRGLRGETQKETEIGPVPESWEIVRVEDNARAISKGASPKWQGFNYVDDGVLFVRSQNVGDGVMEWDDKIFLPPAWNEKEKRSILCAGDVLINLVGASIGRSAVGGEEIEGANCNQAVCFVRLFQEKVLPEFLNGFLLTAEGQRQIHENKKDIARANLSLQDVRQILMPKPTVDEQREITTILDAIDRKIALHRRKRAVLDELFKALLHKLMNGEIRIADLDWSALAPPKELEAAE